MSVWVLNEAKKYTDEQISTIVTPADYVVEQGSNANGTWRKWADGTLECWGMKTFTSVAITTSWGSNYVSPNTAVTWPISFAVIESVNINVLVSSMPTQLVSVLINQASSHQGNFYFWRTSSSTYDSITVGFCAKGRWE